MRIDPGRAPVAIGGMLAALGAAFGLLAQVLPIVFSFLAPLPLALAALLLPSSFAVLSGVASALVVGIFLGPMTGVGFFLRTVLLGLACGFLVRAGKRFGVVFVGATLAQIVGSLLYLLVQLALMGFNWQSFLRTFTGMEDELLKSAEQMDLYNTLATSSGMDAAQAKAAFTSTVHTMVQMTPAMYVLLYAALTGIVLLLLQALCLRLHTVKQVAAPHWRSILMPPAVVVLFIIAWMALLAERHFDNQVLWIVAANVMVIGAACMAVGGLSYCLDKLKITEKPFMTQLLVLLLVLFMGVYLIVVLAVIGVFDSICDYRHLRSGKGESSQ